MITSSQKNSGFQKKENEQYKNASKGLEEICNLSTFKSSWLPHKHDSMHMNCVEPKVCNTCQPRLTRRTLAQFNHNLFLKALTALKQHTKVSIYVALDQQFDMFSLILREWDILVKNFCLIYIYQSVNDSTSQIKQGQSDREKVKVHNNTVGSSYLNR